MCNDSSSMLRAAEIKDRRVKSWEVATGVAQTSGGIYVLRFRT